MHVSFSIAARPPGTPPSVEDAGRVGAMRRITAARLRYCGLEAMTGDVTLAVSELLTNALLHSGSTSIGLFMAVGGGALRLSVVDGMPGQVTVREPAADEESGRGLQLLAAVVEENHGSWGVSSSGAETWCVFALPAGAP